MEVAAFVVSALALGVAAFGGFFSYRQARAAHEQAKAAVDSVELLKGEDARQRTPEFAGTVTYVGPKAHRLTLTLRSPWPLMSVQATLADADGVRITDYHGGNEIGSIRSDFIAPGGSVQGWVVVAPQHPESITMKVVCAGEPPEQWTVFPSLDVFPEYESRRPKIDKSVEWTGHGILRMRLTLESAEPLQHIEAKMLEPEGFLFTSMDGAGRLKRTRSGPLRPGGAVDFWLVQVSGLGGFFRVELVFTGERGESWSNSPMVIVPDLRGRR